MCGFAVRWIKELGGPTAARMHGVCIKLGVPASAEELCIPKTVDKKSPWNIPDMKKYPAGTVRDGKYTGSDSEIDKQNLLMYGEMRSLFPSFVMTIYTPRTVQTSGRVTDDEADTTSRNADVVEEEVVEEVVEPVAKKRKTVGGIVADNEASGGENIGKTGDAGKRFILEDDESGSDEEEVQVARTASRSGKGSGRGVQPVVLPADIVFDLPRGKRYESAPFLVPAYAVVNCLDMATSFMREYGQLDNFGTVLGSCKNSLRALIVMAMAIRSMLATELEEPVSDLEKCAMGHVT